MKKLEHDITWWSKARGHFLHTFFDRIYQQNFHIIWPINDDSLNAYFAEFVRGCERIPMPACGAKCAHLKRNDGSSLIVLAFTDGPVRASTIAHEAFHATEYVMEHVGMGQASEAWAYYIQFITGRVVEAMTMQPRCSKTGSRCKKPWTVTLD